jgi:hypothetical protein
MEALSHDFRSRRPLASEQWQGDVIELVRSEARGRNVSARVPPFGAEGDGGALTLVSLGSDGARSGRPRSRRAAAVVSVGRALVGAVFGAEGYGPWPQRSAATSPGAASGWWRRTGQPAAVLASAGVRSGRGAGAAVPACLAMEEAQ